jgi:hypothetical protein
MGQGNADQEGFPGSLDETRLYNRALNLTEINALPHPATLISVQAAVTGQDGKTVNSMLTLNRPGQIRLLGSDRISLLFGFDAPIESVASVNLINGKGQISGTGHISGKQLSVNLAGLVPQETVTLQITGISDENGNTRDRIEMSLVTGN